MSPDLDDQRILARAAFFAGMADRLSAKVHVLQRETYFRADSPVLMARCYFLLSDAYKPWRNSAESLTDEYKRAALSALAVMAIRPFSPLDPEHVDKTVVYLANPLLALACANAWAAKRDLFEHFPFDYLKRFYLSLDAVRIPPLDEFVGLANEGADYTAIRAIRLTTADLIVIDEWVLKLYILCNLKR